MEPGSFSSDLALKTATDPQFAALVGREQAAVARVVAVSCQWGNCVVHLDPLDGTVHSEFGPAACPCDDTPGWRSRYLECRSRPAAPVKVRGRHGSRVQRSRRRHTLPTWEDWAWLPAAPRDRTIRGHDD